MIDIHINIGSNIDRAHQVVCALDKLKDHFLQLKCSSIYQSKAVGFSGASFYNLGVNAKTKLDIVQIKDILRLIETQQGRKRNEKKFSARLIDLDLILYGNTINKKVNIPRSDILKYAFVLAPLAELMPNQLHPTEHLSYQQLWQTLGHKNLKKYPYSILGENHENKN